MLKRWSIVMIVVALVALAAMPAGAAPADKTSYIVAECPDLGNPQSVERFEFPNPDRLLIRGARNIYYEYLYDGVEWSTERIGENDTVANGDATFPGFVGPFWGTFHYFDYPGPEMIGDFSGTWSWGNSLYGHASGRSADGRLLKVTLGLDPGGYPALPGPECIVNEFLVISPQG
jgi:hypothetical protein